MTNVTVLKLKSGELLIAGVREAEDNMVWLDEPIQAISVPVTHNGQQGETFLLKPWIGISSDTSFLVSAREIITSCTLKKNLLDQYNQYVGRVEEKEVFYEEEADELELLQSRILRSRNLLN